MEDYEFVRQLGTGSYGLINLVRKKSTQELFCLKEMPYSTKNEVQAAQTEVFYNLRLKYNKLISRIPAFILNYSSFIGTGSATIQTSTSKYCILL